MPTPSTPRLADLLDGSAEKTKSIANKQLEDWALRLATCADEAHVEDLRALESDLLDLRDEILFELHSNL